MAGSDVIRDGSFHGELPEGHMLRERYRVLRPVDFGVASAIYLGRDLQSGETCIIKEFPHMTMPEDTFVDFRDRLRTLMTLRHPALMDITDHFSESNRDFYVAEYIDGETLRSIIENAESHLPIEQVRHWAIAICDALSYLHNRQPEPVFFPDLRPSHVMIDRQAQVHLLDFGTGEAWKDHFNMRIEYIYVHGWNFAPDVFRGEVSPRTDIYALGATLHHALTRRDPRLERPFSWEDRPIQQFNPAVPDGLVAIVNRALAIEASERFATADDMRRALEALG